MANVSGYSEHFNTVRKEPFKVAHFATLFLTKRKVRKAKSTPQHTLLFVQPYGSTRLCALLRFALLCGLVAIINFVLPLWSTSNLGHYPLREVEFSHLSSHILICIQICSCIASHRKVAKTCDMLKFMDIFQSSWALQQNELLELHITCPIHSNIPV